MGAGNVKLVYARWYHLPDLPFRVLAYMALVAKDGDEKPMYWGGWESLALAAGRLVPERNDADQDVKRVRRAALKAVTSAVGVLIDRGAVRVKVPAAPGRHATYELILAHESVHADRAPSDDSDESNGSRSADTTVHAQPTNGARLPGTTVHADRAPKDYEDQVRTKPKDELADLRTAVTVVDGSLAVEDPIFTERVQTTRPHLRLITTEDTRPRVRLGLGFCVYCYAAGQTVLAADPVAGSACAKHLREAS